MFYIEVIIFIILIFSVLLVDHYSVTIDVVNSCDNKIVLLHYTVPIKGEKRSYKRITKKLFTIKKI